MEASAINIKEIADLAEVSVSTVSKIVNGKDSNISSGTRERVLKIVKEYNYMPYSFVKNKNSSKTLLIGILYNGNAGHDALLMGIIEYAHKSGYSTMVFPSSDKEDELKNITALCAYHVDGVLWDHVSEQSGDAEKQLLKENVPFYSIDNNYTSENNVFLDYKKLGFIVTEKLVEFNHQKIGCLVENSDLKSKLFVQGYKQCLYDHKILFDEKLCSVWSERNINDLFLYNITGIVCFNAKIAREVYKQASLKNTKIPKDLSVVGMSEGDSTNYMIPKLSAVRLPFFELGEFACRRLIAKIEKVKILDIGFNNNIPVNHNSSVDIPTALRNKKIVVVGALNMDTILNVRQFPQSGETMAAKSYAMIPGGKGVNQAIGAAKLGAEVFLIGKVGKDYEGSALYDSLHSYQVNVQGISTDFKMATGRAYIYVQSDGESSIVLYEGANQNLSSSDIQLNAALFENASFCLLQTEVPIDTVEYTAKLSQKCGVKVLLKPAAVSSISDLLIQNVDIFMPNRKEMDLLCPQKETLEEKAQYFLDRGAKTVIVTLGHEGCYLRSSAYSLYFEAAKFEPVDTTGAADAFASTLAVYLSQNYAITEAIKYAIYAAGYSITCQGVPPSLVDKSTLDLYFSESKM